jgi:hypothetical protein
MTALHVDVSAAVTGCLQQLQSQPLWRADVATTN